MEIMELITEGTTLMNQSCRDLYHTLSWVLLDMNSREFMHAHRAWQQNRRQKSGKDSRTRGWLKRLKWGGWEKKLELIKY